MAGVTGSTSDDDGVRRILAAEERRHGVDDGLDTLRAGEAVELAHGDKPAPEIAAKLEADATEAAPFEAHLSPAVFQDCVFEPTVDEMVVIDIDGDIAERLIPVFHKCRFLPVRADNRRLTEADGTNNPIGSGDM
jgi:hypothetical protein